MRKMYQQERLVVCSESNNNLLHTHVTRYQSAEVVETGEAVNMLFGQREEHPKFFHSNDYPWSKVYKQQFSYTHTHTHTHTHTQTHSLNSLYYNNNQLNQLNWAKCNLNGVEAWQLVFPPLFILDLLQMANWFILSFTRLLLSIEIRSIIYTFHQRKSK